MQWWVTLHPPTKEFGLLEDTLGKGIFITLPWGKSQQPKYVSCQLCQLYRWHRTTLIPVGGLGLGRRIEYGAHSPPAQSAQRCHCPPSTLILLTFFLKSFEQLDPMIHQTKCWNIHHNNEGTSNSMKKEGITLSPIISLPKTQTQT